MCLHRTKFNWTNLNQQVGFKTWEFKKKKSKERKPKLCSCVTVLWLLYSLVQKDTREPQKKKKNLCGDVQQVVEVNQTGLE